jgi:hypothetical protein
MAEQYEEFLKKQAVKSVTRFISVKSGPHGDHYEERVFWDVTMCIYLEDGGNTFLRNISKRLSDYTASHPGT